MESILSDRFTAIFHEKGQSAKRVRFSRALVPPADIALLREGATFYWCMGYKQDENGEREYSSFLRFRRSPRLSLQQIEKSRQSAAEIAEAGGAHLLTDEEIDREIEKDQP